MSPLTLVHPTIQTDATPFPELREALRELEYALDGVEADKNHGAIAASRRRVAEALSRISKRAARGTEIEVALTLLRRVASCEAMHDLCGEAESAQLAKPDPKDWPALLAGMFLTAAWRWADAPLLSAVPDWLWGDYTHWLFAAPRSFVRSGDADRFAAHVGKHLEELGRWVDRNLGSKAVRAAMDSYLGNARLAALTSSNDGLKRHAHAHARILAGAMGAGRAVEQPVAGREGRRLRVGFLASHAAAIPSFARLLDSDRFEVSLHAFEGVEENTDGADVAMSAIFSLLQGDNRTQRCQHLPANLQEQLARFQDSPLDVAFFAEDLALAISPLAQLAAARVAPVQIAIAPASVTTGIVDVIAVSRDAAPAEIAAQFTERLAIVPVNAHVFEEVAPAETSAAAARASLGIRGDAFVAVTAMRIGEITGDVMATWVGLLQRVPNSILAIQLLAAADVPAAEIERLGNVWDSSLQAAGVAPERGLIVAGPVASLVELQSVMIAGDVFLDGAAFGEPDLLHVPLSLGLPVITREGKTLRGRLGAALLRSLGLNDLVAGDDAHLQELFELLATDPAARGPVIERVRSAMSRLPRCRDGLAVAECFGDLVERVFDERLALGAKKFRSQGAWELAAAEAEVEARLREGANALDGDDPTRALAEAREVLRVDPAHPQARVLAGRAYLKAGQCRNAIDYLLAAVEAADDARAWFDLADALNRSGRRPEAVQALEASLRLDGKRADAWVMLIEFAKAAGAAEMAKDALGALRECAPDDPRLPEIEASLGHAA